jgi:hypothetical protein
LRRGGRAIARKDRAQMAEEEPARTGSSDKIIRQCDVK